MKLSKHDLLLAIADMQKTEFFLYSSTVISPTYHVAFCNMLQHTYRAVENSPVTEFEGDP